MSDFFDGQNDLKTDSLTGLYDRGVIIKYANYLISKKIPFSFGLIDIDNFKNANDSYGHTAGDKIIKLVAQKLQENMDGKGVIGRFGGDEFLFITENIVEYDEIWTFCRTLFKKVDGLPIPDMPSCYITCTTGISRFPLDGTTYDELMEKTDKALYRGKQKGRSCFIIYLDAKHKDIVLHAEGDKTSNSMQRITTLFRILNLQPALKDGISAVLRNFSQSTMIDHVAIQSKDKMMFSTVHPLSNTCDFGFIAENLFENDISNTTGLFYMNDRQHLQTLKQDILYNELIKQSIKSCAYAVIKYNNKVYGYIRCDMTEHSRIWQREDLEILVTAANAIATALHYQNLELDDLQ